MDKENEYLKSKKVPQMIENFLAELVRTQPDSPPAFLAQWALQQLPIKERQEVIQKTNAAPDVAPSSASQRRTPRCNVIVITGPSGVGKGTLIKQLTTEDPHSFGFCVSHTTRYPRPGEECGREYHFIPLPEFEKLIEENAFVEYAKVHGNYYGTSKKAIEAVHKTGRTCLLDIDVQGAQKVHASGIPAYKIFIKPPSSDELSRRLVGRGTETPEKVAMRLANAIGELSVAEKNEGNLFDRFVVNTDLKEAVKDLQNAIYSS